MLLARLCGRLNELFTRLSRLGGSAQDHFITQRTADKTLHQLVSLDAPVKWSWNTLPSLTEVYFAKKWADSCFRTFELQLRAKRIKSWKTKISASCSRSCSYIFHHLKNKQLDEPTNLVVDGDQNILFQPQVALEFLNHEWDQVFSANVLRHHPLKMLETVWPYIHDKQIPADVPRVSGLDLFWIIQKRTGRVADHRTAVPVTARASALR